MVTLIKTCKGEHPLERHKQRKKHLCDISLYYVYLLHFDAPVGHARHYIGATNNPWQRWYQHCFKTPSQIKKDNNLVRYASYKGLIRLARLWVHNEPSNFQYEQVIKTNGGRRYCPICKYGHHEAYPTLDVSEDGANMKLSTTMAIYQIAWDEIPERHKERK